MKRRGNDGFTFTELMIVVVLIGILATVAVDQVIKFRQRAAIDVCRINHLTIHRQASLYLATVDHGGAELSPADLIVQGYLSERGLRCPSGDGPDDYRIVIADGRVARVECTVSPEKHGIAVFSSDGPRWETYEKPPGSKLDPDWIRP